MKARLIGLLKALAVGIASLLATACEHDLDVASQIARQHELQLTYNPDREPVPPGLPTVILKPGDEAWENLLIWFIDNGQYWKNSDADTVSQHQAIAIQGDVDLYIDIHDTHLYVGFNNEKGYFRQYWRSCRVEEFRFLLDLDERTRQASD